ncbi:MAG: hypothetical protein EWV40_01190 [Microcystis flos-aquae Mf_WU_F_19750830_S460]|uniref:Uncharacterized protein n=1 Tax=Microcystis flos-aquae Mf_WU_F_19750830_S460 TaxID=2486237 RepID=A0A552M4H0_9CHRO|nr:MAG: hypothetical protein EWV40_01190 [Microcystis flos-aquae Mf_WU_F_19750830_S460]
MVGLGAGLDEKIFTPTDERGFLPYTPHPTPYTLFQVRSRSSGELRIRINQLNALFRDFRQFYAYFSHFCPLKN